MTLAFFNDDFLELNKLAVPANDCGFTTGIGIFDTALFDDGALQNKALHYERLSYDCRAILNIELPFTLDIWHDIILELIQRNKFGDTPVRLRTQITGGAVSKPLAQVTQPNILISATPTYPVDQLPDIKALVTGKYPRIAGDSLERCKRLDYSRSYAARRYAESLGCNEAILLNTNGHVACTTTSTIFIKQSGKMLTPPLSSGCLYGTSRQNMLDTGEAIEQNITVDDLKTADNIYLTNSITGLREVSQLIFDN